MVQLCSSSYGTALVLEDGNVMVFGQFATDQDESDPGWKLPSAFAVPLSSRWRDGWHEIPAARAVSAVVGPEHGLLVSEDCQLFAWGHG